MKIIEPSYEVLTSEDGLTILQNIEYAGRTCYKSEDAITRDSCYKFVEMILKRGHESVLEHESISVRFICNRGFTHELVRHRLAAYSQESTRYCNYSKEKFGNEITVIIPQSLKSSENARLFNVWKSAMEESEKSYFLLIESGCSPQIARGVLPIDLKTEIVITANLREWRHIFNLRTSNAAHPSMQQLMRPLLKEFQKRIPIVFDNISWEK